MAVFDERVLILCKTYPSPSGKYTETTCVAGMDEKGNLLRLYPVPFRLISEDQKFKKWQWINTKIEKARRDHRPESHTIKVDTIKTDVAVSTKNDWAERRRLIQGLPTYENFSDIEAIRQESGQSLAILKHITLLGLDIAPVKTKDWTDDELDKLEQAQKQGGLFDSETKQDIKLLKKLPYDFYYRYRCRSGEGFQDFRHKIVDWEVGALYWRSRDAHGENWEQHVRSKLEEEFASKDLMFLMGNQHRFQDQWLIISLIYPPYQRQPELL